MSSRRTGYLFACLLTAGCHVPRSDSSSTAPAASGAPDQGEDEREQLDQLPPLPQNALTGTDADHDHIRDDVAAYIDATYRGDEATRMAARQFARAAEHGLAYARDLDRAQDAGDEMARAIERLYALLPPDDADLVWKELEARTFDDDARLDEWIALQSALSGSYVESAIDGAGVTP